jgi:hypothetical protein
MWKALPVRHRDVLRRGGSDDRQAGPECNIIDETMRRTRVACDGADLGAAAGRVVVDRHRTGGVRRVLADRMKHARTGLERRCCRRGGGDVRILERLRRLRMRRYNKREQGRQSGKHERNSPNGNRLPHLLRASS